MPVRNIVREVFRSFHHERIHTLLHRTREQARGDGGRRDLILVGGRHAVGIQRHLNLLQADRTIGVVHHVIFARPDGLDRHARHCFRDYRGLCNKVHFNLATETTTQIGRVNVDLLRLQAGCSRNRWRHQGLELRRRPNFRAVALDQDGRVERLHCTVGQELEFVFRFQLLGGAAQCGIHVTTSLDFDAVFRHAVGQHLGDGVAAQGRVLGHVPLDIALGQRLFRIPVAIGNHRHAVGVSVVELNDFLRAGRGHHRGFVETCDFATDNRTHFHRSDHHAGGLNVDTELSRTIHFIR